MTGETIGWSILWVSVAFCIKLALDHISKRSQKKRTVAHLAELTARRAAREDQRLTLGDAVEQEMKFLEDFNRSGDTPEKRAEIWARLMLEDDLGRHAESPGPFRLDQDQRDTLLANARKDAAEALSISRQVLNETRARRKSVDEAMWYIVIALWIVGIAYWWRAGSAP